MKGSEFCLIAAWLAIIATIIAGFVGVHPASGAALFVSSTLWLVGGKVIEAIEMGRED